ncbi:MAG: hypothetical protein CL858_03770 [Cupriavidus sp.]|nr:hypothetical protein [Cupriavidus sp.]
MTGITLGFIPEPLSVPVASILIEPLSVTPADQSSGQHVLLDGHLRLLAIQELGYAQAACLVATDDESYTYLAKLLENESARQYVAERHPDLMVEFESIIATISLDQQQSGVVL